jgi:hypothetical protein
MAVTSIRGSVVTGQSATPGGVITFLIALIAARAAGQDPP